MPSNLQVRTALRCKVENHQQHEEAWDFTETHVQMKGLGATPADPGALD